MNCFNGTCELLTSIASRKTKLSVWQFFTLMIKTIFSLPFLTMPCAKLLYSILKIPSRSDFCYFMNFILKLPKNEHISFFFGLFKRTNLRVSVCKAFS